MYDFKERGVDLEVEGVHYIGLHRGPAAYVLRPPPSRGGDLEHKQSGHDITIRDFN